MDITKVNMEDGRACAVLINLLKTGRWDLSGADAEAFVGTKKWVHDLAVKMAEQLKPSKPTETTPPAQGFRVKAMGPIGSNTSKKKKKR